MLSVKKISKQVYTKVGSLRGKPMTLVSLDKDKSEDLQMDHNDMVDLILAFDTKVVVIEGNELKDNGELKELCVGLIKVGKKVNLVTNGLDDIEVIRMHKNILVTFNCLPPSKEQLGISKRNLYLVRERDEVKFLIKSKEDFNAVSNLLTNNVILRPSVYLIIVDKVDNEEGAEIIKAYLNLTTKIKTDTKLIY